MNHRNHIRPILKLLALLGIATALVSGPAGKASAAEFEPHWQHRVVYVENHARGWPVTAAADNLDNGSGLVLQVVKRCPAKSQCIKVYDVWNIPGQTMVGNATTTYYLDGRHETIASTIRLEDSWGRHAGYYQRLSAVSHELGHAVGLSHSSHRDTCMTEFIANQPVTHISSSERAQLRRWYGR